MIEFTSASRLLRNLFICAKKKKKKKKKTGTIINGREISKDYREKGKIIDIFDTNDPNKREE